MKIIKYLFFLFLPLYLSAQTKTQNYVITTVPTEEVSDFKSLSDVNSNAVINYYDGIGRLSQTVQKRTTPSKADLISAVEYDVLGRTSKKWLPAVVSSNNGAYYTGYASNAISANRDAKPYSLIEYDGSPLNRVTKQYGPGDDWQSNPHPVHLDYGHNGTYDVLALQVENDLLKNTGSDELSGLWYYQSGELFKAITKDENWNGGFLHTTEEYKDKLGQVLLKRSYVDTSTVVDEIKVVPVETYYVYDDFGLLRYVIPPQATAYFKGDINNDGGIDSFKFVISHEVLTRKDPEVDDYVVDEQGSMTLKPGFSFAATSDKNFSISTANVSGGLMYSYKYDGRKRMIEKRIPGAASVYMVYDNRDRLVATQDGEQRKSNQWLFTKYDVLNRPILTGLWTQTTPVKTRDALQSFVDTYNDSTANRKLFEARGAIVHGYTNQSFPSVASANDYLTVTYYDDYSWRTGLNQTYFNTLRNEFNGHGFNVTVPSIPYYTGVKGLVTGSKVKELGTNTWLETVTWYDDRYRPVLVRSDNYVGGEDIVLNHYDFPRKLLESWECHKVNLTTPEKRILRQEYTYDHAGRLLTTNQQMTGATNLVTISENSYNELGQLKDKKVGNAIQEMDYKYNIRGWLTYINNPNTIPRNTKKFAMKLTYNDPMVGIRQFNGNISTIQWTKPTGSTSSPYLSHYYTFNYDGLNRLLSASYGEGSMYNGSNLGKFNESITGYDLNGNIQGLIRGPNDQEIDRLEYFYDLGGNQLTRVVDNAPLATRSLGFMDGNSSGNDYSYDLNGNMTVDKNKGIGKIEYNYLNLPKKIIDQNDISKTIEYIYSANGQKLQKKVGSKKTYYSGNFIYEGTSLKQILHSEGYVDMSGTPTYHYYLKDHLGNNRMVVNQSGAVVQQTDYYPFGMAFNKEGSADNKYLYNGKELQEESIGNGLLDWYDYGARMYDPALGRWHTVDPLAEQGRRWSPYAYAFNNPIRFLDPDGMWPWEAGFWKGFNQKAEQFKSETLSAVNDRISNPGLLLDDAKNIADGILKVEPSSEKSYSQAIGESVEGAKGLAATVSEVPSMSSEERGALAGVAVIMVIESVSTPGPGKGLKNPGRAGKQARLRELAKDPKVSSADRGWIKNEMRHIETGNRKTIRNPGNSRNSTGKGKELAHPRGQRAKDGHSYENAKLQDADLHKLEHKHGGY